MKALKLPLLYLLSFVLSLGPIAVFVGLNINSYVSTKADVIKLSAGGIIVGIIVLLKVLGKLKIPSQVSVFACVFLLSYLFNSLLSDLAILSFLALIGEGLDCLVSIFIKREKEKRQNERVAKATAEQMERLIPRA